MKLKQISVLPDVVKLLSGQVVTFIFHGSIAPNLFFLLKYSKETTLERADFTLQLLMFVTAEKEGQMFLIFFLSSFCQLLS